MRKLSSEIRRRPATTTTTGDNDDDDDNDNDDDDNDGDDKKEISKKTIIGDVSCERSSGGDEKSFYQSAQFPNEATFSEVEMVPQR